MKKVLLIIGISLIVIGLFFMFSYEDFSEKGVDYESDYILGGKHYSDLSTANFYYDLAEIGEKIHMPSIIIGGILLGVSFCIKTEQK